MARQNVGNPKFYIDMLSFFRTQGSFTAGSDHLNIMGNVDPVKYDTLEIENIGQYTQYDFNLQLNRTNQVSEDNKHFLAFLNHNFYDENIFKPKIEIYYASLLRNTIDNFDEICNFSFDNNGWSLGEYDGDGQEFSKLVFSISKDSQANTSANVLLGSIAWGQVFQMPHSPDLQLTMTREYDGIKTQQSRGGSTLTQIDYTGSPHWGSKPAWYVGKAIDTASEGYKEQRQYGKGRKTWDLKFSYVSSDNLFPINESISSSNPTDNDTNTFPSGDFLNNAYDDTSFMSVVMGKTLGGALPFIFQPDGNNNSPDQFAICQIDQGSFQFKQVAHNVYDVSLKIREVW